VDIARVGEAQHAIVVGVGNVQAGRGRGRVHHHAAGVGEQGAGKPANRVEAGEKVQFPPFDQVGCEVAKIELAEFAGRGGPGGGACGNTTTRLLPESATNNSLPETATWDGAFNPLAAALQCSRSNPPGR